MQVIFNYNGVSAMYASWLWEDGGVMSYNTYKSDVRRGRITVLQRGCKDSPAVVGFDSMHFSIRSKVEDKMRTMGVATNIDENGRLGVSILEGQIAPDDEALRFYAEFRLDNGKKLPLEAQKECYTNAIILNALREVITLRKGYRNATGFTGDKRAGLFGSIVKELAALDRVKWPHSLPMSERNLRAKMRQYFGQDGKRVYGALIHSNFGNSNSRKVTGELERLILSLYCQSNNPYSDWVHAQYLQFAVGALDVVDTKTGMLFDPKDFVDADGNPIVISEGTVWNYINKPSNKVLIDSIRMSYHKFGALSRPHYHRHNAMFSLSKVSLDDRDLPHKLHDGKRVKAYYAYDVCSGALIGAAYSRKKDGELFIGCLRDMFQTLDGLCVGLPLEMEVENHLVRQYEDDLFKAGEVFPFVRWCAPTNSQEKHAEQFNRQKKYGYEKRYQDGIGRHSNKLRVNQVEGERFYNEATDEYEFRERTYDYDQVVADDRQSIVDYNNGLHRDQKRYPGKTRMQVLMENLNPELKDIDRALLVRYIGNRKSTRVVRNQYVTVNYGQYQLSCVEVLGLLKPNDYSVDAYWLSDSAGRVGEVYVYQDGKYVDTCKRIETYTTARAEWSDADAEAMSEQAKYIAHFDRSIKERKSGIASVKVLPQVDIAAVDARIEAAKLAAQVSEEVRREASIDELMEKYDAKNYREYAIETI